MSPRALKTGLAQKAGAAERPSRLLAFGAARAALLNWYDANKRALPWRENKDPYRVLVSELMLQQTQVKTALPYYERFLKKFPTAQKLAKASESEVLAAWAGLGYYRRARFLQAAAKTVAASGFPKTEPELRELRGVGEYTAAAVGSICFGLPLAVVDGNVIRVLARLLALDEDAKSKLGLATIKETALALLDQNRPGDFNQAVMELGALICSPRAPQCGLCPLSGHCAAFKLGQSEAYPRLAAAVEVTRVRKVAVLIEKDGALLAAPRGPQGRMEGFWQFPEREIGLDARSVVEARSLVKGLLRAQPKLLGPCGVVKHTITRYRIEVEAFRFGSEGKIMAPWRWVEIKALKKLPLASAEKKLLRLFEDA